MEFDWKNLDADKHRVKEYLKQASTRELLAQVENREARKWCYSALWQRDTARTIDETLSFMFENAELRSECGHFLRYMTLADIQQGLERFVVHHPERREWVLKIFLPMVGGSMYCLKNLHAVTWPFYRLWKVEEWRSLVA